MKIVYNAVTSKTNNGIDIKVVDFPEKWLIFGNTHICQRKDNL